MEYIFFTLDRKLWWEFCFPLGQLWLDGDDLLENVRARTLVINTGASPVVVFVDFLDNICHYFIQFALFLVEAVSRSVLNSHRMDI